MTEPIAPTGRPGYYRTLKGLALRPRGFFTETAGPAGLPNALRFLFISALIMALVRIVLDSAHQPVVAAIDLASNFLLPLINALLGLPLAALLFRARLDVRLYLAVFAYAGGAGMLVVWLPGSSWSYVGEIVKWTLAWVGLCHALSFERWRAMAVIAAAIALTILIFWIITPR